MTMKLTSRGREQARWDKNEARAQEAENEYRQILRADRPSAKAGVPMSDATRERLADLRNIMGR
jgi:hypothetical protein